MTLGTFIVKNALRNKRRAALSVVSVSISLFLLVTLLVVQRELTMPPEDIGAALRVVVRNRVSLAQPLPARQRPIIERLPGVEAVSPFSWFGGRFKSESFPSFAQFAMDANKVRAIFGEAKMAPGAYEAFEKDRTTCILGALTAEKYGIKAGDKIQFTSDIYFVTLEFKVVGIYSGTIDDRNVLFHQKYLDEATGNLGQVGTWWVKVRSAEDMPMVIKAINDTFANSSAEVRAESERAFQLSFVSMWGNIRTLVNSICTVVVFTLVLVSASTMSMAVRERFRELAILKALGFRRRELFAFILAESFGLALMGAILGIGGGWLFYTHTKLAGYAVIGIGGVFLLSGLRLLWRREWVGCLLSMLTGLCLLNGGGKVVQIGSIAAMTQNIIITSEVTGRIIGLAMVVAACLGIISCVAPVISVARTSVVDGLKTLD
ncbi:MAG: ABC transporter permease [Verrucomicrobiota bacterium]